MAITFISPDKKQNTFRGIITLVLVLVLFVMPFIVFTSFLSDEFESVFVEEVPKPDISINFDIIDSEEVKNLESFSIIKIEFSYSALDKNNRKVVGKVLAIDKNDALSILQKTGLKNINLEEINAGKKEPFIPYYP